MPTTTANTIIKALVSTAIAPGLGMLGMSTGMLLLDDKLADIAAPFINPINVPIKPFLLVLGSCKVLAGLALWKIGPMSEKFARVGLMITSACGAYGHYGVEDSVVSPLVFFWIGRMSSRHGIVVGRGRKGRIIRSNA